MGNLRMQTLWRVCAHSGVAEEGLACPTPKHVHAIIAPRPEFDKPPHMDGIYNNTNNSYTFTLDIVARPARGNEAFSMPNGTLCPFLSLPPSSDGQGGLPIGYDLPLGFSQCRILGTGGVSGRRAQTQSQLVILRPGSIKQTHFKD